MNTCGVPAVLAGHGVDPASPDRLWLYSRRKLNPHSYQWGKGQRHLRGKSLPHKLRMGVVVQAYNLSTQETEAGGLWVHVHSDLLSKTLSQSWKEWMDGWTTKQTSIWSTEGGWVDKGTCHWMMQNLMDCLTTLRKPYRVYFVALEAHWTGSRSLVEKEEIGWWDGSMGKGTCCWAWVGPLCPQGRGRALVKAVLWPP